MKDDTAAEEASFARSPSESIAQLIADAESRIACLGYLVESLVLADLNAPHRWGLVLTDGALELRVGKIAVLSLLPEVLRCVVDRAQIPAHLRMDRRIALRESGTESAFGAYPSVRGAASVDLPAPLIIKVFPALRSAHRFLIVKAGVNCRYYADPTPHDPAVLAGLAVLVDGILPVPDRSRA